MNFRGLLSSPRPLWVALIIVFATIMSSGTLSAQQPFKRGLETIMFVPKGQWITGVNVNYAHGNESNYQFFIFEGISGDSYSFKVSPMLLYAFKDNLALGGRFSYQRQMTEIKSGDLVLDSETNYNVDHFYAISQNFYGSALFRNYLSMGQSTRFGFFNELQLQLGGGQSKLTNGKGEDFTGTFERNFSLNVGMSPGVIMFLNNYSAIEVSVGLLGFGYTHTKSITDQVHIANRNSNKANFKVNLFSISFGVAFYL